ncbi:hypothetical protein A7K94_0211295 [Modestobacter sp. VKM Ac-2676]|nr:hypothetical protein A7K94_0211295 [Modestobacter sp. VKM Ac-2676]
MVDRDRSDAAGGHRAQPAARRPRGGQPVPAAPARLGLRAALDWRYTAGSPERPGPADVWTRVRVPLVADQELTGLDRTLIAADAANGISAELPLASWLSIPPGMTTHLTREPDGEWVHLSCRTSIAADGIGLCLGTLSDARGEIGQVSQPLLVQER